MNMYFHHGILLSDASNLFKSTVSQSVINNATTAKNNVNPLINLLIMSTNATPASPSPNQHPRKAILYGRSEGAVRRGRANTPLTAYFEIQRQRRIWRWRSQASVSCCPSQAMQSLSASGRTGNRVATSRLEREAAGCARNHRPVLLPPPSPPSHVTRAAAAVNELD